MPLSGAASNRSAKVAEYHIQEKKAQIDQIKIDFSDLDQIRANASKPRDSL